ncbi:MAG: discoidin domain-containing protein [Bacteroides sp.]|jgi:hypothetical protein|nr:discoidin domain-containing protein [Bacteroides sp.]MCI1681711.1 discoidin domain-containing protein [Bacteroides sp.]
MKREKTLVLAVFGLLLVGCGSTPSDKYSRGVGIYPGNPNETSSPELVVDNSTYRNLAVLKAAYQSSSYDYNLTAQLVTDGIISTHSSSTLNVSTQDGSLKKNEREWLFDGKPDSKYIVNGNDIYLQVDFNNMRVDADKLVLRGDVTVDDRKTKGYEMAVYASVDGKSWNLLDIRRGSGYAGSDIPSAKGFFAPPAGTKTQKPKLNPSPVLFKYKYKQIQQELPVMSFGNMRRGRPIIYEVLLKDSKVYKHYKFVFKMAAAENWAFNTLDFYKNNELLSVLPSACFNSAWQSATPGKEWLYVDLGAPAKYDKINLYWINKAVKGKIQSSNDAKTWIDVASLPGGTDKKDIIILNKKVKSRYVRLLLTEAESGQPYQLSEIEIYGKGGLVAHPKKAPVEMDNRQYLSGGNWKLQRASEVEGTGEEISSLGYKDGSWIPATVPGTVLASYINISAVPDPNFADNQLQVSESFFLSDFWYRDEFIVTNPTEYLFLNFDGINWKADVYLNGKKLGRMEGAFIRGKFDVSKQIVKGKNVIAVKIIKNAHPGAIKEQTAYSTDQNGGALGADNPTFHATIGWDWIPTIRGRDIGIWNDVFLTYNGSVTIEDPFVRTELPLPDTTSANVFVEVTLKNHSNDPVSGMLKGTYGKAVFKQPVNLTAGEEKLVKLNPSTTPVLHLKHPLLWWPKGYGAQHLYNVCFSFEVKGKETDKVVFKSGVRQMTYDENVYKPSGGMSFGFFGQSEPRRLSIYVNGRRFVGFGGNWGFSESNLNYRKREYDIAVAYHADMNFTMIRNWVGQIGDEEFYEACDKYGVMVWQDFWLANPLDGPNPFYVNMFNANAKDYVKRIRNHPSMAIYVGRNEGNPPAEIDNYLRTMIQQEHPDLYYISNSAMGIVSGGGPYRALPPKSYFQSYGHDKFHSERGMPNVMNYESMLHTFGYEYINPVNTVKSPNSVYGLHDYTLGGTTGASAQAVTTFNDMIEKAFGHPKDAKLFSEWAQWINYNGYRAIFESRSEHRRGMLLWMSHPAWPSMVWQTYDYYFDPTAAYFGCKKGAEPLHIQWNPLRNDVEVVNYHAFKRMGLIAKAQIFNQDGALKWEHKTPLNIEEDQTVACFPIGRVKQLSDTYFIKLMLTDSQGKVLSDNFYWRGKVDGDFHSLLQLPKVHIQQSIIMNLVDGEWILKGILKNETNTPALMIRLKVVGNKSSQILLPVFYSDNYFSLMPGEKKEFSIKLADFDTHGEKPEIRISGFNL